MQIEARQGLWGQDERGITGVHAGWFHVLADGVGHNLRTDGAAATGLVSRLQY